MPLVFACIAPHGGHLVSGPASKLPESRAAMKKMRSALESAKPDAIAILTPHGVYAEGLITVGASPTAQGELDRKTIEAHIDVDLASAWAYQGANRDIPVGPVTAPDGTHFPLDWGVTIPVSLLDPAGKLPLVVSCPARDLPRQNLVDWGAALVDAADALGRRVALVVSADQGHGHAADGPYGFTALSRDYDTAMVDAVKADDIESLLLWDEKWIEAGMPDSYWQTLALIGVRRTVSLKSTFLSYEIDHYFGLMCAMYELAATK